MSSKVIHDPRDASLETKESLPFTWKRETFDGLNASGMMLAGLIVVTRNRYLAWPAVLVATSSVINTHSLRAKDGSGTPWANLILAVVALFLSYLSLLTIPRPGVS